MLFDNRLGKGIWISFYRQQRFRRMASFDDLRAQGDTLAYIKC
jgi:hypothetical protein